MPARQQEGNKPGTRNGDIAAPLRRMSYLDSAGVPTTAPPFLEPRHVEAVLGWRRKDRLDAERSGILEPLPRDFGRQRRYLTTDVAHAIVRYGLRADWDRLDD